MQFLVQTTRAEKRFAARATAENADVEEVVKDLQEKVSAMTAFFSFRGHTIHDKITFAPALCLSLASHRPVLLSSVHIY